MKNPFLSVAVVLSLAFVLGTQPVALRAQAPSAAPQTPTQTQTPNTAPAQKKVWTNDDMDELRDQGAGGISVIGSAPAAAATPAAATPQKGAAKPAATPAKVPDEKNPDWYRKQLAPLYESLDRINDQIAAAQSAIDGDSRGDSGVSMGARAPAGTPAEQVAALQKEQQGVQDKIDALLDMARHNDIEPGELR
jgi:hypothetical protein